ncbi:hypothetical protein Ciccas_004808 [Cichlidogyrus casuarinus]|uniref:Uncharacterized protein n=1 Tax=Cichlidogyrus casuarinus TaxID=1844966 RepID=A0ABD2QAI3_9PLAT
MIYLSASSTDSDDYPSPLEDDADDSSAKERWENLQQAKPTLMGTTKNKAVLIGGLTRALLCQSRKLRRYNYARYGLKGSRFVPGHNDRRRRQSEHSSSESGSSGDRRKRPNKVEYITTFGASDDEGLDAVARKLSEKCPVSSGPEPSTAASLLAASVVSKILSRKEKRPPVQRPRRRSSSSSSDAKQRIKRRARSSSSSENEHTSKPPSPPRIRRYYRPELESDQESLAASDEEQGESKPAQISSNEGRFVSG